uniref:Uncharacterized protein n=1 Tax=Anguilla anguilla TaxID=7936 RepID=A0A0E9XTU7_ANGAN
MIVARGLPWSSYVAANDQIKSICRLAQIIDARLGVGSPRTSTDRSDGMLIGSSDESVVLFALVSIVMSVDKSHPFITISNCHAI